ncbi:MAG: 2-oxoglutarate oxidoreductase [Candidatus Omnitrophica bacterium]|nr:2-oxoglutarate oxidoreductase [Candidatus Omnitrophota bacterium]MBU4590207.1 2-oxoglutarate oxidoreductase [Candidatus Omnitrophota bacterium]
MSKILSKPKSMKDSSTHYCAGCGHGIVHRLICEIIDELGIREETIGIAPVGCAVIAYDYWNFDVTEAAHGRVPAVATGIKRVAPENIVFGYQGDGDLAAIGTAEIVHAANRGENITIIFVNNAVYGMTGGQMAPTTMLKQKTATTPLGRDQKTHGFPLKVCELLSVLPGVSYAERVSIHSPQNIIKAKKAIKRAFQNQIDGVGFSIVEVLSQCPTYIGLSPEDSVKWVAETMIKEYPLGVFR